MIGFQEKIGWKDERMDRPCFTGTFRLPPGVQQKSFAFIYEIKALYLKDFRRSSSFEYISAISKKIEGEFQNLTNTHEGNKNSLN